MEVFRISTSQYADKLSSSGRSNRWNLDNEFVIYAGSSRSLSTLELIVHRSSVLPKNDFRVMVISLADEDSLYHEIKTRDLPANWRTIAAYATLQKIGSEWYHSKQSLILRVPSAVIPQEYNCIINTRHPDYQGKIHLVRTEPYFWDQRLI